MPVSGDADRAAPPTARARLAGFWNGWFRTDEIARARALAVTAPEDECARELERLEKERNARLERWRMYQ